ncbi:hypothetical protein [Bergeyella zoohelcum]|uniref:Uncharacterized protein n=1 Tax=Bergeyella zoohelcum TaxID=1015 RepID=A0A7Z8YN16_9FLAO|nr:hypothetical protein [Bergeyella zoohelcum]VDH03614.1 Uncharacterised protein [Bergeyella zoohelcum]
MTENQHTEIVHYLISKKLSIDIIAEVYDHFVTQITALMVEGHAFEEAFNKTQLTWSEDLKVYWNGSWDLDDKTDLERRMYKAQRKAWLKASFFYSLKAGMVFFAILFLLSRGVEREHFLIGVIILLAVLGTIPFMVFIKHRKTFKMARNFSNYKLNSLQGTMGAGYGLVANLMINLRPSYLIYYDMITDVHQLMRLGFFVITIMIILFGIVSTLVLQYRYIHSMDKISPFLKYLKEG